MSIRIFYDGECPFCNNYVHLLRLRESHGVPQIVDLREHSSELQHLLDLGFDVDQGIAVTVGEQWYYGDRAIHVLAKLSTSSTAFNRVNRILFSSSELARWVYPALRVGRNATLFLLGRRRLREEAIGDLAPFVLFNIAWGLFAVLHAISYSFFSYGSKAYISTALIGVLGAALLLKPSSARIFISLLFMLVVDASLQPPLNSNHTIIKNFLILAMLAAGARQLWL